MIYIIDMHGIGIRGNPKPCAEQPIPIILTTEILTTDNTDR